MLMAALMYMVMSILYNFRQTVLKDWFAQVIPSVDGQPLRGLSSLDVIRTI